MKWSVGSIVAVASFVLIVAADHPQDPAPLPQAIRYQVPYRLTDTQHVLVRAKINGKGPFNLILDTGAPAVFITQSAAKAAGVRTDKEGWGHFDTFVIEGGAVVDGVKCRIEDLVQIDGMNTMGLAGVELHGVIGYNVLARFRITYDFTSDKLLFERLPQFQPPEPERLHAAGADTVQMMGPLIKLLAALTGLKANFAVVPRGFFGVELSETDGHVTVAAVYPDSPAQRAGLQRGDVIVRINNTDIDTLRDVQRAVSRTAAGSKITMTFRRGRSTMQVAVELGKGL